jgi:hypothetical protein
LGFPIANDPLYNDQFAARRNAEKHSLFDYRDTSPPIHVTNGEAHHMDETCQKCKREFMYPTIEEMWLHARLYQSSLFRVETDLPLWAREREDKNIKQ